MHLIVGLGNPGREYAHHRHNIGFLAVDALAGKYNLSGPKKKFESEIFEGSVGGERVLALKPQTYMNLSGDAVRQAMDFYKIPLSNVIVIHDELDLPPSELRIKTGGGSAGHNGLRSIDGNAGNEYKRLRFGIGHPGHKDLVSPYVLHDFSREEWDLAEPVLGKIAENFPLLLAGKDKEFLKQIEGK